MERSIYQIPFKVFSRLLFYRKSQFWSKEELGAYQDRRLRLLVRHAARNVPYYKELFRECNLDPASFRGRQDLVRIPLLDKETVRKQIRELTADNARKFGLNWDSTSGSTGKPLHFISDDNNQANKIAALLRSYFWAGYRLGHKTLSMQSYYFSEKVYNFNPFLRVLRFDSNRLKQATLRELAELINRLKPRIFMGFPFDLCLLAELVEKENIKLQLPEAVICYGETLSKHKRKTLQNTFGCNVYNFYSLHESAAMISECEYGNLHLIDDFAFHEIIDDRGRRLKENGKGNLVGTGYYNFAMPFIRYDIGDEVIMDVSNHSCPCGRNFPVIKEIIGKRCDYIETPDGRLLGAVMSHSIDNAGGVICSQCVQQELDLIEVNLIADSSFDSNSRKQLETGIRKRVGNRMRIRIRKVEALIKSTGGKTPFIISEIGNKYR